jgi:hypothetical protein
MCPEGDLFKDADALLTVHLSPALGNLGCALLCGAVDVDSRSADSKRPINERMEL